MARLIVIHQLKMNTPGVSLFPLLTKKVLLTGFLFFASTKLIYESCVFRSSSEHTNATPIIKFITNVSISMSNMVMVTFTLLNFIGIVRLSI
jgi:hypothetical protein